MRRSRPCPVSTTIRLTSWSAWSSELARHGVSRVILFGLPEHKDEIGSRRVG